jgi:hypothetical protein
MKCHDRSGRIFAGTRRRPADAAPDDKMSWLHELEGCICDTGMYERCRWCASYGMMSWFFVAYAELSHDSPSVAPAPRFEVEPHLAQRLARDVRREIGVGHAPRPPHPSA